MTPFENPQTNLGGATQSNTTEAIRQLPDAPEGLGEPISTSMEAPRDLVDASPDEITQEAISHLPEAPTGLETPLAQPSEPIAAETVTEQPIAPELASVPVAEKVSLAEKGQPGWDTFKSRTGALGAKFGGMKERCSAYIQGLRQKGQQKVDSAGASIIGAGISSIEAGNRAMAFISEKNQQFENSSNAIIGKIVGELMQRIDSSKLRRQEQIAATIAAIEMRTRAFESTMIRAGMEVLKSFLKQPAEPELNLGSLLEVARVLEMVQAKLEGQNRQMEAVATFMANCVNRMAYLETKQADSTPAAIEQPAAPALTAATPEALPETTTSAEPTQIAA